MKQWQWIAIGGLITGFAIYVNRQRLKQVVWDYYSEQRIENLHPAIRKDVRILINKVGKRLGIKLRVGKDGHYRSLAEQKALHEKYLAGGNLAAPAGKSWHNVGLAVDLYQIDNGEMKKPTENKEQWEEVVKVAENEGFEWLGWIDPPHFQKSFGYALPELVEQIKETGEKYPQIA